MELSRHAYFIIASYGMLVLAVVAELISLRGRRRRAAALIEAQRDES